MIRRLARKFIYLAAVLIVLTITGAFAYRIWGKGLLALATVPTAQFEELPA